MTGAVIEYVPDKDPNVKSASLRLLTEPEMTKLFNQYNDLLNDGVKDGYTMNYCSNGVSLSWARAR